MRRSANSRPSASSRDRKDSTRLSESIKKSAGPTSPAARRNLPARGRLSSEWQPCVGDHPPVAPARGAVREKQLAVVRTAPRRACDPAEPQRLPLLRQRDPKIHVPRRGLGALAEAAQHFRTYFIALTTNTYSTMHYDVTGPHKPHPLHELHAALEDAPRRAPPSGVEQRHHLLVGCREVDRDAVGDGDGEQQAPGSRRMAVRAVDNQPPVAGRWMPTHRGPVHLVRQDHAGEARTDRGANGAPARHHLADVLFAPQAEGEAMPAGRDPGHEAVAGGPFGELHARDGGVADGYFTEQRRSGGQAVG